jgi:hypothetical protein
LALLLALRFQTNASAVLAAQAGLLIVEAIAIGLGTLLKRCGGAE